VSLRVNWCCLLQGLLVWNPFRTVRSEPQSLLESLVNAGNNLGGNSCPANATNPLQGCPPGSYCPTPEDVVICPIGHYWCVQGCLQQKYTVKPNVKQSNCTAVGLYCPTPEDVVICPIGHYWCVLPFSTLLVCVTR
jgi:hypothetical protein